MKKIIYALCILSLTALIALTGCKKDSNSSEPPAPTEKQITGTWKIYGLNGSFTVDILGKPISIPVKGTLDEIMIIVEGMKILIPEDQRAILDNITNVITLAKQTSVTFNADHTWIATDVPLLPIVTGSWSLSGNNVKATTLLGSDPIVFKYEDGKLKYHLNYPIGDTTKADITIVLSKK